MEGCKTLFCSLKFPRACGSISLKFIDNLSTHQQKSSPTLVSIPRFTYTSRPSAYILLELSSSLQPPVNRKLVDGKGEKKLPLPEI